MESSDPEQNNEQQMDQTETSFSIDEIKGIKTGKEQSKKRVIRKTREPKEKFTTDFLIRDTGIPKLVERGRNLKLDQYHSITKQSDVIMAMYHSWAKEMYGLDQFEDVLTK
ncbi:hypothetical protein WA577_000110, partial [Blastocystis sp. JDR]